MRAHSPAKEVTNWLEISDRLRIEHAAMPIRIEKWLAAEKLRYE